MDAKENSVGLGTSVGWWTLPIRGKTSWLGISELLEMSVSEYVRMNAQSHSHSMSSKVSVRLNPSRHVTKSVAAPLKTACSADLHYHQLPADQSQLAAALAALGSCEAFWSSAAGGWWASLGKPLLGSRVWFTVCIQLGNRLTVFSCRRILPAMPALGLRKSSFKFRKWHQYQGGTNFPSGAFSDFGSLGLNETLELLLLLLLSLRHESWAVGIFAPPSLQPPCTEASFAGIKFQHPAPPGWDDKLSLRSSLGRSRPHVEPRKHDLQTMSTTQLHRKLRKVGWRRASSEGMVWDFWETGRSTSNTQSISLQPSNSTNDPAELTSNANMPNVQISAVTFQDISRFPGDVCIVSPKRVRKNIGRQGFSTHLAAPELVTWGGHVVITCDIHVITSSDWDWTSTTSNNLCWSLC